MSIREGIKQRMKKSTHFTWNGVEVFVKDEIVTNQSDFSLANMFKGISNKIPKQLLSNVDVIYIGNFSFLNDREVQAVYENSSIFITNVHDDESDMAEDIVHEIAHSLEEIYKQDIYGDGQLKKEFLNKRTQLHSILKSEKMKPDLQLFLNPSFTQELDDYLYKEVGYSTIEMLSSSIFDSAYSCTSLREYFATGFESFYYYRDSRFLKNSCPVLYEKLYLLTKEQEY